MYVISEGEAATTLARTPAEVVYPASTNAPIASLLTFFDALQSCDKQDQSVADLYVCLIPGEMREYGYEKRG
jgi:hypothetical protein